MSFISRVSNFGRLQKMFAFDNVRGRIPSEAYWVINCGNYAMYDTRRWAVIVTILSLIAAVLSYLISWIGLITCMA